MFQIKNKSQNKKILFALLYLSEGAPIGFIWWTLPTILRKAGVELYVITGLTATLILPWIFKFLWSPIIDMIRSTKWNYKSWIIVLQLIMLLSLIPLLFFDLKIHLSFIIPFLFLHTFSAASQDAAIDGMAISCMSKYELGSTNAWMQSGMLLGRALIGGLGIIIFDIYGQVILILILISIIGFTLLFLINTKLEYQINSFISQTSKWNIFKETLKNFITKKSTWLGLVFALVSGFAFEGVGAVAGPYLVDNKFSSNIIGLFFGLFSIVAMILGSIFSGFITEKYGKLKTLKVILLIISFVILFFSLIDIYVGATNNYLMIIVLTLLYFFIGMFTVSSYSLFMDISDSKLGATQFSAFMGATNACESFSTWSVGKLIPFYDYSGAFIILAFTSLLSLPLLKFLKKYIEK